MTAFYYLCSFKLNSSKQDDEIIKLKRKLPDWTSVKFPLVHKPIKIIPMTNNNDRSNNRLDRIEAIVESNARAIQGMLEQQATDRLKREEEKAEHERRMRFLEESQRQLIQTQQRIANLVASLDEDRPTVLRKLTAIEN